MSLSTDISLERLVLCTPGCFEFFESRATLDATAHARKTRAAWSQPRDDVTFNRRGPRDVMNKRILHPGSEAQAKGDSSSHGL